MTDRVKTIISHLPPRHLDDYLAVAVAKHFFPNASVKYVSPSEALSEEELNSSNTIIVDVGGIYNPRVNTFDHHQDSSLPCSFVLLVKNLMLGSSLPETPAIKEIDAIDRLGFKTASELFDIVADRDIDELRKVILMTDPGRQDVADTVYDIINQIDKTTDMNIFIRSLYVELDRKGLLREVFEQLKREEAEFEEKMRKAEVITEPRTGIKVVLSDSSFAPFHYKVFREFDADIIIERNMMNPQHSSIIKNSSSQRIQDIDLSFIFYHYPKVFLRQTGFIAVVDCDINQFDVSKVTEYIGSRMRNRKQSRRL